jgi:anaerobic sulfite reductase subunit B
MLHLTPQTIRIVDCYDDGEDAKHFTFEPVGFTHTSDINIGQFFMLTVPGAGQAPFTYTALPAKNGKFVALIRKVGKLTNALFKLSTGDVLGYNGPFGSGWPIEKLLNAHVLIVAGGCGLAPVAATVDHLINIGQADLTTVIYGAGNAKSQVLAKERTYWKSKLLLTETLLAGSNVEHRGIPSDFIAPILNEHHRQAQIVLTCGPEGMMRSVANSCMDLSIHKDKIWFSLEKRMRCGVGLCGHCYLANELVCKQGPTYRYDDLLKLENKTSVFPKHKGLFSYC